MTERREIKQRSPAVWARAKEAYLAGEPAASVARRFDVGYGNLRYRAHAEGWTRKAVMAREEAEEAVEATRLAGRADPTALSETEPPLDLDPAEAFEAALARAGAAIAAGRGAEAAGLLKAAETLARLRQATPPEHLPTPEEWAAQEEARRVARVEEQAAWREAETARLEAHWGRRAFQMAHALLSDRGHDLADGWAVSALRWRAENLGPEQALADFARAVEGGWAARYWDEYGRLKPVEPPPLPDDRMWRQHIGQSRGQSWAEADMTGVDWPPKGIALTLEMPVVSPVPAPEAPTGPRARRL